MRSRTRRRRLGAVAFSLVVLVAAAVTVLLDQLTTTMTIQPEVATISRYDVDLTLEADGTLRGQEAITVAYPVPRRGIFRIFDTEDPRRDLEHPVTDLEVTRDGRPEPWTWQDSAPGTETARIGQEDVVLDPGEYTYDLAWQTRDVLEPGTVDGRDDPDTTLLWWDVIGAGWQMPIAEANVRLELPAEPTSVECVIGEGTSCEPFVEGTTVTLAAGALAPFEPVTLRVGMPSALVAPNDVPGPGLVWTVLAGLAGLAVGLVGVRSTRERKPGFPVLYEPPPGVRPAVGVRVLDEAASEQELQATLFDLGDRGVTRISSEGGLWWIELVGDPAAAGCEPWEVTMLSRLGLDTVGDSFVVARNSVSGQVIAKAAEALEAGAAVDTAPYLRRSALGSVLRALAWLTALGLVVMAGFSLLGGTEFWPWGVAFLAGFAVASSVVATDVGATTVRTAAGRDVWSRTGGFARFLSTDSSESRFDAAAHLDWFPHYLPWAVALGVSDEWARRYQAQGVDPPEVPYLYGWGWGPGYARGFSDLDHSFAGAITAASAAYAASQASSGGGGGFSGGSGGGGGGGGSW